MIRSTTTLAALYLSARILAQTTQEDKATFSIQTRLVITPVTVTNHNGNIVKDLTPKDFRLRDNDSLQQITEDIALHPISMVIAVQASSEVERMLPPVQKLAFWTVRVWELPVSVPSARVRLLMEIGAFRVTTAMGRSMTAL